jgi:hypothetical protein
VSEHLTLHGSTIFREARRVFFESFHQKGRCVGDFVFRDISLKKKITFFLNKELAESKTSEMV